MILRSRPPDAADALAGPGPWRIPGLLAHPDGYLRHVRLAAAVLERHNAGTVLNVGDPFCQLRAELPGFEVTSTDREGPLIRVPDGARFIRADFTAATSPFAKSGYDLVCSTDTLEHIPRNQRAAFIARAVEVARRGVYLAFPAGPDARAAEALIMASRGRVSFRDALAEHAAHGLPDLGEVDSMLSALGLVYEVRPLTTVVEWLTSFLFCPGDQEDPDLVIRLWSFLNEGAASKPGNGAIYRYLVEVRI